MGRRIDARFMRMADRNIQEAEVTTEKTTLKLAL